MNSGMNEFKQARQLIQNIEQPSTSLRESVYNPSRNIGRFLMELGDSREAFLLREFYSYSSRLPKVQNALNVDNLTKIQLKRLKSEQNNLLNRIEIVDKKLSELYPAHWPAIRQDCKFVLANGSKNSCISSHKYDVIRQNLSRFCEGQIIPTARLTGNQSQNSLLLKEEISNDSARQELAVARGIKQIEEYSKRFLKSGNTPKCPIDERMLIRVCREENFPVELFMGLMMVESGGGLLGRAVGTKNPLNFGNDDEGNSLAFKSWEDGVRGCIQGIRRAGFGGEFSTLNDILFRKKLRGYYGDYCPPKGTQYATKELPEIIKKLLAVMDATPLPRTNARIT